LKKLFKILFYLIIIFIILMIATYLFMKTPAFGALPSGKSLEKNGWMIRLKRLIPPALSAMFIKPINKVIMPISPKLISTAVCAVPITPLAS